MKRYLKQCLETVKNFLQCTMLVVLFLSAISAPLFIVCAITGETLGCSETRWESC